jgi:hypothetical protein
MDSFSHNHAFARPVAGDEALQAGTPKAPASLQLQNWLLESARSGLDQSSTLRQQHH